MPGRRLPIAPKHCKTLTIGRRRGCRRRLRCSIGCVTGLRVRVVGVAHKATPDGQVDAHVSAGDDSPDFQRNEKQDVANQLTGRHFGGRRSSAECEVGGPAMNLSVSEEERESESGAKRTWNKHCGGACGRAVKQTARQVVTDWAKMEAV
jgi:hypothetical protein